MGCRSESLEVRCESEWINLVEAIWALECRHLLGEVSLPDYRQQKELLLAGRRREFPADWDGDIQEMSYADRAGCL